tara:strand:+ start:442 stop:588 length:147 start_codon:yes stop_codon:yes gene_type:complete
MTREDLKTIIKIADHVVREQPVWIANELSINDGEIKRLCNVLNKERKR